MAYVLNRIYSSRRAATAAAAIIPCPPVRIRNEVPMNAKLKLILGILGLVVLLGGSAWLYHALSGRFTPDNGLSADKSSQSQPLNTESTAPTQETDSVSSQTEDVIPAPDFAVTDYDGNVIKFSDFQGKPIIINFWASWCPPCKAELPSFNTVYEQLGDDVVFLMINATDEIRETKEKAKELTDEEGYTFPVYYDTEMEASNVYGVSSLPSTVFIDRDGNIVTAAVGQIDESALLQGISMIYTPGQKP